MKNYYIILLLLLSRLGSAQSNDAFAKATVAYNAADFPLAIKYYKEILSKGEHSAAVYYNLGNAYYKLNDVANSIYFYEKGLLLKSDDEEILNNLHFAQKMTLDAIGDAPRTKFQELYNNVLNSLTYDEWAYISIGGVILCVLFFLSYYYSTSSFRKKLFFIGCIVLILLSITSLTLTNLNYNYHIHDAPAIVFSKEVPVVSEPNSTSNIVFTLHEGTKISVLDALNNWNKIKLNNGDIGWLESKHLKLIKDFAVY